MSNQIPDMIELLTTRLEDLGINNIYAPVLVYSLREKVLLVKGDLDSKMFDVMFTKMMHNLTDRDLAKSLINKEVKFRDKGLSFKELFEEPDWVINKQPFMDTLNEIEERHNIKVTFETVDFVCAKCKHDKALYYEVRERAIDEPMTSYYVCVQCSNKHRFG